MTSEMSEVRWSEHAHKQHEHGEADKCVKVRHLRIALLVQADYCKDCCGRGV